MPKQLTHARWLEFLKQKAESEEGPAIRRKHSRYYALGYATIREKASDDETSEKPKGAQGELLQVSAEGCMVRTHRELKSATFVEVEILIDDDAYVATGKVIHSTSTVGSYKTGIQLTFPEPATQEFGGRRQDQSFKKHNS